MTETYKRYNYGKAKLSSIDIDKLMLVLEYATKQQTLACESNSKLDKIIEEINSLSNSDIVNSENSLSQAKDPVKYANSNTNFDDIDFTTDFTIEDFNIFIPKVFISELIKVFLMGANKYGLDNYLTCEPSELYTFIDSAFRHISKMMVGEYNDDESKLQHAAHVGANMAMIMAIQHKNFLMQERIKNVGKE